MKPTFTIEMCKKTLDVCSEGADYQTVAKTLGVANPTVTLWYKRGMYEDGDRRFKSHPLYQLFSAAIEIGKIIYSLKQFKIRLEINKNHNNQGYRDHIERRIALINDDRSMSRLEELDFYYAAIRPSLDHMTLTGQITEKIDQQILSLRSYFESLALQVITFEPTWENVNMGRPRKDTLIPVTEIDFD